MCKNGIAIRCASILILATILFAFSTTHAQQGDSISSLDAPEKSSVERILESEIARLFELMRETGRDIRATDIYSVRLEPQDNSVHVHLDKRLLGRSAAEMEPFLQEINIIIHDAVEDILIIRDIHWYFNGRNLYEYHPGEKPPQLVLATPSVLSEVVVNAGHGRYLRNFPPGTWDWQRPFTFGVREDLVTPEYASVLADLLAERSLIGTQFTRSQAVAIHAPSGNPWREVAARYYLEQLLPGESHIWDGSTSHSDLHYGQDINSRPRYANFIDAESLISIHTNAVTDQAVRGTRIYVAPGRPVDYARAQSMLCYVREIVQAQDGYEDFTVSSAPHTFSHGENSIATMPAVIVEVAFHSNLDDAAAILDPVFQLASMKGVEKGYRLHREEKPCTPFELLTVTDGSAPHGGHAVSYATFEGYPQYPLTLEIDVVSCAPGWICSGATAVWPEEVPGWPNDIGWQSLCDSPPEEPPATHVMRARLIDEDNVTTDWEEYNKTCGLPGLTVNEKEARPVILQTEATIQKIH